MRIVAPIPKGTEVERKKKSCVIWQVSRVTCHVSNVNCRLSSVTCHLPNVTCHLSLVSTARAMDPPSANSPTMYSKLVGKGKKEKEIKETTKRQIFLKACIFEYIIFDEKSQVHRDAGFPNMDRQTEKRTLQQWFRPV